jgi:nucleoside phosphorylase
MEACGAGLICKRLGIPFSVIKTVADTLNAAPDKEYKDFLSSNAQKCADVFDFVRAL